jgi:hypothetical protein
LNQVNSNDQTQPATVHDIDLQKAQAIIRECLANPWPTDEDIAEAPTEPPKPPRDI